MGEGGDRLEKLEKRKERIAAQDVDKQLERWVEAKEPREEML